LKSELFKLEKWTPASTFPFSKEECRKKDLLLKLAIKVSVPTIIARVTSDIPDKGQVTIRSSGLYANIHRGKIKKASLAASTIRIVEDKIRRLLFRDWADMIRKVYEVEPILV
jgi:hypothetical protein